jgi:hypothetical protein
MLLSVTSDISAEPVAARKLMHSNASLQIAVFIIVDPSRGHVPAGYCARSPICWRALWTRQQIC